jgi:hypothetical protein
LSLADNTVPRIILTWALTPKQQSRQSAIANVFHVLIIACFAMI